MKTSTTDMVSETAVEFKSYMRSYSPYLDDGIPSEASTTSIHTAGEETVPTASTGVTQQVEMRGRRYQVYIALSDPHKRTHCWCCSTLPSRIWFVCYFFVIAVMNTVTGLVPEELCALQSFQSSATVLDPAANLSLFRSTSVIIIKVYTIHALKTSKVDDLI